MTSTTTIRGSQFILHPFLFWQKLPQIKRQSKKSFWPESCLFARRNTFMIKRNLKLISENSNRKCFTVLGKARANIWPVHQNVHLMFTWAQLSIERWRWENLMFAFLNWTMQLTCLLFRTLPKSQMRMADNRLLAKSNKTLSLESEIYQDDHCYEESSCPWRSLILFQAILSKHWPC